LGLPKSAARNLLATLLSRGSVEKVDGDQYILGATVVAFNVIKLSMLNSVLLVLTNVIGTLTLASISAYVFARFRFPGRELLFWFILAILFIPGILTFATRYMLVAQMGLLDTYWVMIIPLIAGGQVFDIFVLRGFFAGIPEEILEAARIDGAGRMIVFLKILLPMSRPILATLAVMRTINVWNEWLWPMITVSKYELRPMAGPAGALPRK